VPEIHAIFWDVGGVLLTNAWDHTERAAALEHFRLNEDEFHARHEMVVSSFERGKISLNEYLDRTVFYTDRSFTREEFRNYMFSLSQPMPEVLAFAHALARSGKYFMGTINNESPAGNLSPVYQFLLRGTAQTGKWHLSAGHRDYANQSGRVLLHRRPRPEPGVRRETGHEDDPDAKAGTVARRPEEARCGVKKVVSGQSCAFTGH
jgi:hypothetical protein